MKKETILPILVCVLVFVLGVATGYFFAPREGDGESWTVEPDHWAIWSCHNRTDNWSSVVPIYEEGDSIVYPDAYEMTMGIRNIETGQITESSYIYCELERIP
ncbi:MAG: hypothetical protein ACXADO_00555 [Candidatus Thorarchaeota archaeon]